MDQLSIPYFRDLLSSNINNLENLCKVWTEQQANSSVPEEVIDEIRCTVGLTNLLLSQKIKQFKGLIDDCEFKRGEKEITCLDLQGFWDMVFNEIEKIQRKFEKLSLCKSNNWVFEQEVPKTECKKKMFPALAKTIIPAKNHASAARQRLIEVKRKMKAQMAAQNSVNAVKQNAEIETGDENTVSAAKQRLTQTTPVNEEAINTTQDSKIIVPKDTPTKRHRKRNSIITDESIELKSAISNITNVHISEQSNGIVSSPKKIATRKNFRAKAKESVDKENIMSQPLESKGRPQRRRKTKEEFIPLQCVTRSAKRAMMAKQN